MAVPISSSQRTPLGRSLSALVQIHHAIRIPRSAHMAPPGAGGRNPLWHRGPCPARRGAGPSRPGHTYPTAFSSRENLPPTRASRRAGPRCSRRNPLFNRGTPPTRRRWLRGGESELVVILFSIEEHLQRADDEELTAIAEMS